MKIITDIKKTNSSYGNWAIHISEQITDSGGYTRTIEQPKFFWTKKEALEFLKEHTNDIKKHLNI